MNKIQIKTNKKMQLYSYTYAKIYLSIGLCYYIGAGHFRSAVSAPPFGRHHLSADRFHAGTSRHWDISAPAVTAPDVSALALYAAAAAMWHSDTNNTSGT